MGVAPGHTTVIATTEAGAEIAEYDVTIRGAAGGALGAPAARTTEPGAHRHRRRRRDQTQPPGMGQLRVTMIGKNSYIAERHRRQCERSRSAPKPSRAACVGNTRDVINNLELLSATQVNVRVRVAEISRQITRELGFNWQAIGKVGSFCIGLRTGPAPARSPTPFGRHQLGIIATTASRFAAGVTTNRLDINSVIDALAGDNLITILAEPNLTAQSGETASFLAGGEFPIPAGTADNSRRHHRRVQAVRRQPLPSCPPFSARTG